MAHILNQSYKDLYNENYDAMKKEIGKRIVENRMTYHVHGLAE
jgi:hypothetical protein